MWRKCGCVFGTEAKQTNTIPVIAQLLIKSTRNSNNENKNFNNRFGDPSLGGLYRVNDKLRNAVNDSGVNGTQHLYLTVNKNASWELTPTDFNSPAALSVCEFHGPLGTVAPD